MSQDEEFQDPAEWSQASYSHHPIDDLEPIQEDSSNLTPELAITRVMLMALKGKTLAEIGLRIKMFALLCGGSICEASGETQSSLSKKAGFSRQNGSKTLKNIAIEMGMHRNANFKTESAVDSYKNINKKSRTKL